MGMVVLVLTGPRSSTGSPMTLRMRPSVSGPPGTRIGPPVSITSAPRTRPSVVSMATARTVFSPSSCATSSTRVLPWFCTWSALRMNGSSPSNLTSTTAPMTCATVPVLFLAMMLPLERLGARNDLDQFLGDGGLTRAVISDVEPIDHLAGVACRVVHRRHARALLRCSVFQERGEDLDREVAWQQLGKNFAFLGLKLVDRALEIRLVLLLRLRNSEGDELLLDDDLADRRLEAIEHHGAGVELTGLETFDQTAGDVLGIGESQARPADFGQTLEDELGVIAA